MTDQAAETAILTLVEARGPGKSICPTEAAQILSDADWRRRLPEIKQAAIRLAKSGQVWILRKGKPVDPDDFKGVYRITVRHE